MSTGAECIYIHNTYTHTSKYTRHTTLPVRYTTTCTCVGVSQQEVFSVSTVCLLRMYDTTCASFGSRTLDRTTGTPTRALGDELRRIYVRSFVAVCTSQKLLGIDAVDTINSVQVPRGLSQKQITPLHFLITCNHSFKYHSGRTESRDLLIFILMFKRPLCFRPEWHVRICYVRQYTHVLRTKSYTCNKKGCGQFGIFCQSCE